MLRKVLLATVAAVAFANIASAADMPVKAVPYTALYNWTGLYAGVNLGYGWARTSDDFGVVGGSLNGVIGGG